LFRLDITLKMTERAKSLLLRVGRLATHDGYAVDLNPVQWQALQYLRDANRFSRTPGALADWLGATKGTVSQTVKALVSHGLVARQPSPADKRSVYLELTHEGLTLLETAPESMIDQLIGAIDTHERNELERLLGKMLQSLLARRGGSPFGLCRDCRHFQKGVSSESGHLCALLSVPLNNEDSAKICVEQETA